MAVNAWPCTAAGLDEVSTTVLLQEAAQWTILEPDDREEGERTFAAVGRWNAERCRLDLSTDRASGRELTRRVWIVGVCPSEEELNMASSLAGFIRPCGVSGDGS